MVAARARHHPLDEAASVIDIAAHRDFEDAVRGPFRPERGLVAVGGGIDREIGQRDPSLAVDLDRALHQDAGPIDHDVLESGRTLRLVGENEVGAACSAARLGPARQ